MNANETLKLTYLAPELPSLSATFVMNEVRELRRRGHLVHLVSVHRPATLSDDESTRQMSADVFVLYGNPFSTLLGSVIRSAVLHPVRFIRSVAMLVGDLFLLRKVKNESLKLIWQWLHAAVLANRMQRNGTRHLHIHFSHVPTQIGMYASGLSGIPYSFTGHANDLFENGRLLEQKVSRAKRMVTISEFNRTWLTDRGIETGNLEIIHCGIDLNGYSYSRQNSVSPRVFRIGSLARLVEKKGMDVLIRAVGILTRKGRMVHLDIAGSGPEENYLRWLVREQNLQNVVTFSGPVDHDQVSGWMRKQDAFVLACKPDRNGDLDGIPVVLMEAMALGIPVVSTRLSGIPELIIHKQTGLLAHPGNPGSLAAEIENLIDHPGERLLLSQQAALHVETNFNLENNVTRLETIFREGNQ